MNACILHLLLRFLSNYLESVIRVYYIFILIHFNKYYIFRLIQYEYDLQTSRDRLTMFSGQLKDLLKHKEEIRILLLENENEIHQLKTNLSNFGVK